MHDPAQTLREWLLRQASIADLVGSQIAIGKHLFGDDWVSPSKAILILRAGGPADLYTAMRHSRMYVECFGTSYAEAAQVAGVLVDLCKSFTRDKAAGAAALLIQLNQDSDVAQLWDEELEAPAVGLYVELFTVEVAP